MLNVGAALSLDPDTPCSLLWQTNGMAATQWWTIPGNVSSNGVASALFTADVAAPNKVTFFFRVGEPGSIVYDALGTLNILPSPGYIVAELPLPWGRSLDFATIEVTNPPWPSLETVSNLVAAVEGGVGGVIVELDPHATPIAEEALELARGAFPATWDWFTGRWTVNYEDRMGPLWFKNGSLLTSIEANSISFGQTGKSTTINALGGSANSANWIWPDTPSVSPVIKRDELAAATNSAITSIFAIKNALLVVSNEVAMITTNGVPIWSSASSADSIPPSVTNELWISIAALQSTVSSLQSSLAGISRDWGSYAPDGSTNPDPDYMLYINRPATVWASGFQWATSGGHAVLTSTGMVAFAVGDSGEMRIGPGDGTNYFGFVQGGSVEVGARAAGLSVVGEVATILYPHESGAFPVLWFTPDLAVPFEPIAGVVWVDNADGSATVTAPATTPRGFWRATTSATYTAEFRSTMPARFTGGVWGATNAVPVIYDSTIQISSGGKTYRIPAEEL